MQQVESKIRGMATDLAASTCEWLHLIERFDRGQGWAGVGVRSCAAWLSWTCSVSPGTAREYVRVARMLPLLPLVDAAFAAGRLSYSKIRALVRIADRVDEAVLLQQAQVQTVSQFERTVRAFRRTDGDGWGQQQRRRAVWRWDDDGMLVLSARLPPDEGALLVAALERARQVVVARSDVCGGGPGSDGQARCTSGSSAEARWCGDEGISGGGDAPPPGDGDAPDDDGATSADGVTTGSGTSADAGTLAAPGDSVGAGTYEGAGRATGAGTCGAAGTQMPSPTDDEREQAKLTDADEIGLVGADALMALAKQALAAGEVDSSGDDRHLLILHADADLLAGDAGADADADLDDDAGSDGADADLDDDAGSDCDGDGDGDLDDGAGSDGDAGETVPEEPCAPDAPDAAPGIRRPPRGRHSWRRTAAGSHILGQRCHIEDGPGLDRVTAERIACDAAIVAVVHRVGEGELLRLGRKTRAISPAQRRALRIRDAGCTFPACHRRHFLEAHHVRPWSLMGRTDLENLVLLCRFHHMLVHEGGFRVARDPAGGWAFRDPQGAVIPAAPGMFPAGGRRPPMQAPEAPDPPDPLGLMPAWAGEPFHLAEAVAVLARHPRTLVSAGSGGPVSVHETCGGDPR